MRVLVKILWMLIMIGALVILSQAEHDFVYRAF